MSKLSKFFSVPLIIFCIAIFLPDMTYAQASMTRTIVVQGSSSLQIPADEATIRIGVESTADTAELAIADNNRIANQIQTQLLATGLRKENIQTTHYNFYPQYNDKQQITSYIANNTITITTDSLDNVGKIIKTAIDAGANKIDSITFSAKGDESLRQKALQLAAKDAKLKAQSIASSLGKEIINIVNVTENNVSLRNYHLGNFSLKSAAMDTSSEPPIQPGNIDVTASLNITFEIN